MATKRDNEGKRPRNKAPNNRINVEKTPVSERQRLFSEAEEDDLCSVCWNDMKVYAVGLCDHPICSTCSVRSRVLCDTKDCAICRQDMPQIMFSHKKHNFKELADRVLPKDKRYQICFEDDGLKKLFEELLMHVCPLCDTKPIFRTFNQLDKHVRREHELFYCELCAEDLRLFSNERKLYTRSQLATHRRKGDPDDSSHRGHPLCKFCEARYVDDEALFRHLRKDHFFCHFCDADGIQEYYPDYNSLRDHFKSDHYLCEEGGCVNERFTNSFRDELDLKAHRLDKHSGGLSKTENRLNRMVGIEVSYSDDHRHDRRGPDRRPGPERRPGRGPPRSASPEPEVIPSAAVKVPDMASDFPTLCGANVSSNNGSGTQQKAVGSQNLATKLALSSGRNIQKSWATGMGSANLQDQDFPSLPGSNPVPTVAAPQYKPNNQKKNVTGAKSKNSAPGANASVMDFPSLPGSKPLSSFGATTYKNPKGFTPAWSSNNDENQPPQAAKPRKAPTPAPNLSNDFPSLGGPKGKILSNKDFQTAPVVLSKNKKKNKTENKPAQSNAAAATTKSNLKSAADLIFSTAADKGRVDQESRLNSMTKQFETASSLIEDKTDFQATRENSSKIQSIAQTPPREIVTKKVPFQKPPDLSSDFPTLGGVQGKMSFSSVQPTQNKKAPSQKAPDLSNDFPSLGGVKGKMSYSTHAGLTQKPAKTQKKSGPPGFAQAKQASKASGFQGGGGTYSGNFKYIDPPDFKNRNSKLLNVIITAFGGGKSLEFANFKKLSNQFKENLIDSDQYVKDCSEILDDSNKMNHFMPELIALLPNIPKQKALIETLLKHFPQSDVSSQLDSCLSCGQILARMDKKMHSQTHELESDFPSL